MALCSSGDEEFVSIIKSFMRKHFLLDLGFNEIAGLHLH